MAGSGSPAWASGAWAAGAWATGAWSEGTASDGYTWNEFATVWASIEPLSAREFLNNNQVVAPAEARVTIRWMDGIDPTMRIRYGDRIYNIMGVLEDNKTGRDWITLPVSRGTNEG